MLGVYVMAQQAPQQPQLPGMQVVPPAWLRLFSTKEVGQLLSGGEAGAISVQDLRQHTAYSGGFSARSSTVAAFWKVCRGCCAHLQHV